MAAFSSSTVNYSSPLYNLEALPPSNVFFDSFDAEFISDVFCGPLASNTMRHNEYAHCYTLYKNLVGKNGCWSFFEDSEPFVRLVKNTVKTLLTRKLGRDLLTKVYELGQNNIVFITPSEKGDQTFKRKINGLEVFQIALSTEDDPDDFIEELPEGGSRRLRYPPHINFGHELIHLLGYFENSLALDARKIAAPTVNRLLRNLEEQRTITGIGDGKEFDINEHSLARSFGFERFRWNHLAVPRFTTELTVSSVKFQEYWDLALQADLRDEIFTLIDTGEVSLHQMLHDGFGALAHAARYAGQPLFQKLYEKKPPNGCKLFSPANLVREAADYGNLPVLKYLHENQGISLSDRYENGWTLRSLLEKNTSLLISDKEAVTTYLKDKIF